MKTPKLLLLKTILSITLVISTQSRAKNHDLCAFLENAAFKREFDYIANKLQYCLYPDPALCPRAPQKWSGPIKIRALEYGNLEKQKIVNEAIKYFSDTFSKQTPDYTNSGNQTA